MIRNEMDLISNLDLMDLMDLNGFDGSETIRKRSMARIDFSKLRLILSSIIALQSSAILVVVSQI